nr:serine:threonine protein kinase [Hymenolepis microstoma]
MTDLSKSTTDPKPFRPVYFLGNGYFSFVYLVRSHHEYDKDYSYALKRFFLRKPEVLLFAQKEYRVLELLALDPDKSPFLPTLYYSFTIDVSPTFIVEFETDVTLSGVVTVRGSMKVKHARFYLSEVICAVRYLHEKQIVHMKLKPNNVLLTKSGHIKLVDFDHSYNLYENRGKRPTFIDFSVDYYFAAPEVAGKIAITEKADIWSLGVLMACLMGRSIRRGRRKNCEHLAKVGYWSITRFSKLRANLRNFFKAVFTLSYSRRPSIEEVQKLAFFHDVNWVAVQALAIKPPLSPSEVETISFRLPRDPHHNHPLVLDAIYNRCMPKTQKCRFISANDETECFLVHVEPVTSKFRKIGYTFENAINALKEFNFIHPYLSYKRGLQEGKFTEKYVETMDTGI